MPRLLVWAVTASLLAVPLALPSTVSAATGDDCYYAEVPFPPDKPTSAKACPPGAGESEVIIGGHVIH